MSEPVKVGDWVSFVIVSEVVEVHQHVDGSIVLVTPVGPVMADKVIEKRSE